MKIKFTQLGFFFFTLFAATHVSAQSVNTLRVDSPPQIAGEYRVILTEDWGQQLMTELSGTATFVNDGEGTVTDACDGAITNITGKIAFIDRGSCEFGAKALAAENAGAVAVVICNNVDGPFATGAGAVGNQVSIPVVGMLLPDCQTIRTVADGNDIESAILYMDIPCPTPTYGPEVVWFNDFSDGLGDWVISCEGDSCWAWTDDEAILNNGSFAGGVAIQTATSCNGFIVMDSDFLDNTGNQAFGSGVCPADCVGSLISPTIDLTAIPDLSGLFIEIDQQTRQFQSTYQVILSKNGGVTWPDTLEVNGEFEVNSAHFSETLRIPAPGYENANSITMQFRYIGNYYYWAIDDVRLVNEAISDMNLRTDFFAVAPTYRTPLSQAVEIPFLIDIDNIGNVAAEDVTVDVVVVNESGTEVFSTTNSNFATQPGGEFLNENSVFPETFTPDAVGFYTGTYTVNTSSNDENTSNDSVDFTFEVTEDILSPIADLNSFANPIEGILSGSVFAAPTSDFYVSNYATGYIFNAPNGSGHVLNNTRFGMLTPDASVTANIDLYVFRWAYTDEDNSGAFVVDPSATQLVGVNKDPILVFGGAVRVGTEQALDIRAIDIAMVSADENGNPQLDNDNNPVRLELADNSSYVFVVACRSNDGLPINLMGFDPETDISTRSFLHGATNLAADSLGLNQVSGGFLEDITATTGPVDIQNLLINNDLQGQGGTGNFGVLFDFRTIFLEMRIQDRMVGTEDINTSQAIEVFPNPATDRVFVDLALENVSQTVNVEIVDAKGQRVLTQDFNNILNNKLEINTSNLVSGFYNVNVRTEAGLTSKKVMIQK